MTASNTVSQVCYGLFKKERKKIRTEKRSKNQLQLLIPYRKSVMGYFPEMNDYIRKETEEPITSP